ncbi:hypothetical protein E2C01_008854 [Portunus trituberculatus]|uniref:Uncharacterized protein n=1 Tax=Portunus trituberculatus TaxID=210409 RepID=A0A5B7D4V2_PORTR|nr:hypothetical protein [Portunus trituberculatus]
MSALVFGAEKELVIGLVTELMGSSVLLVTDKFGNSRYISRPRWSPSERQTKRNLVTYSKVRNFLLTSGI